MYMYIIKYSVLYCYFLLGVEKWRIDILYLCGKDYFIHVHGLMLCRKFELIQIEIVFIVIKK